MEKRGKEGNFDRKIGELYWRKGEKRGVLIRKGKNMEMVI